LPTRSILALGGGGKLVFVIQHFRALLDDPVRLAAFQRAILASVRPGDIVADIGCGLGTFAVFACRAGAQRVYAVEESPIIELAREVVRVNGFSHSVHFLPGRSTKLAVPERVQVAIFEDYPTSLLSPSVLRTVRDLVSRWLTPEGRLVPDRARLFVAAVEDAQGHQTIDRFAATHDRVAGVDFSPTRSRIFSSAHSRRLGQASLLTAPFKAADVTLPGASPAALKVATRLQAVRQGAIHGLLLWFELELGETWLGTGPEAPASAWAQTLFPLESPIQVGAGSLIELALDGAPLGEDMLWRWRVSVGEEVVETNTLQGMLLGQDFLAKSHEGHIPAPCEDFDIDRTILNAVDARRSVGDIADEIARLFPDRFETSGEAARRVACVLYGRPYQEP